ncbi:MAG: phosphotransferase, partial [Deltaproteobacteria bacterium]|nr:phosphotransferase [Deltaproteobacteria bacterium]
MISTAKAIINQHYDLGELLWLKETHLGFCNRNFTIKAKSSRQEIKYHLRLSNPSVLEKEVKFEHVLIRHLRKNGFTLAADVILNKRGETYVKVETPTGAEGKPLLWAVYEFIGGEDRYTWEDTNIDSTDFRNAAQVLARLHQAGHNFTKPQDADRVQPPIMKFLPTLEPLYEGFLKRSRQTEFDRTFQNAHPDIIRTIHHTGITDSVLKQMPCLPIHGDFHPGNLKYHETGVTGVFDFDWSKVDLRLVDLAYAIILFCAIWEGRTTDGLDIDKCRWFMQTYNETCRATSFPGSLNQTE